MSDATEALEALRVAVAHGLPGAARASGGAPRLTAEVIALATRHRVQGLLWSAIDAGALVGAEQQVEDARNAQLAAMRTCLIAEETAVLALEALSAADVDARVLKGIAVAHLDHTDPAERVFGDSDILIRRDDYPRALRALIVAGFRRAEPPVRDWWEQRFGKAIVWYAPSGGELDLHLAITGGYFGERINHEYLWSSASPPFDLGGVTARGLDSEGRLLHACCHAVLGGGSGLRARRDVAQLVLLSGADWPGAVACAQHDEVECVLAEAARATWAELSLDSGHPFARWAHSHASDPVQQRALAGYVAAFEQGWAPEGRGVLAALGAVDKVRFLSGLAVPSRSSMRFRQRTWRQQLRTGAAALRRR